MKNFSTKVLIILPVLFLQSCTQDQQNQLARKTVEYLDGNYLVTFANGPISKSWTIKNGKVTSTEKGYYFFWDEHKHYVQVPIENSFIEEIGN